MADTGSTNTTNWVVFFVLQVPHRYESSGTFQLMRSFQPFYLLVLRRSVSRFTLHRTYRGQNSILGLCFGNLSKLNEGGLVAVLLV